jgi:hypothetical protein
MTRQPAFFSATRPVFYIAGSPPDTLIVVTAINSGFRDWRAQKLGAGAVPTMYRATQARHKWKSPGRPDQIH